MKTRKSQQGVYAIEFVLVSGFLFLLLFLIVELGKVLHYYDAASQATRAAARLGTVCTQNSNAIKTQVTSRLPFVTSSNVVVTYLPGGCTVADCQTITVALSQAVYTSAVFGFNVTMPSFTTTLPRESLDSQYNAKCS